MPAATPASAHPSTDAPPPQVLLLPGWLNSGPGHWQTLWETEHGDHRVQQADWLWPRRGDWMARLDEAVLARPPGPAQGPLLLAAHSLGCHLVAAWAAHSQHTARVQGALLVAPPDLLRPDLPLQVARWAPPVTARLPFPALLVYSSDDPYAAVDPTLALAAAWGARPLLAGAAGHLNADSGLGRWPQARHALLGLASPAGHSA